MLIAGLTGGIASGKSTVAGFLKEAGAFVVDADLLSRVAVMPGRPAYDEIRHEFGEKILGSDGTIDRTALGNLVFSDEGLRRRLETIIHPRIKQLMDEKVRRIVSQYPQAVVIKDIPLLLETGMEIGLAEIIVVYIPEALQITRLIRRDGLSHGQARMRISSQMPMEEKKKHATIVIDNSGTPDYTRFQTQSVFEGLYRRAQTGPNSKHLM